LSYRLDHVGPLARSVADAALIFEALAGFDPHCPDSRCGPGIRYDAVRTGGLDGVRLGVLDNFSAEPLEAAVSAAFDAALDRLRRLHAEIVTVRLPTYDVARGRRAGFLRVEAEATFLHGPLYRQEPERFSPEIRAYLDYGAKLPATRLLAADRRIDVAAFELGQCLEHVDAIVSPTTPQAAPSFAEKPPDSAGAFCIPANFAGFPAISIPMGANERGLPLGLQLIAKRHADARMLEIAACVEAIMGSLYPPPPIGPTMSPRR